MKNKSPVLKRAVEAELMELEEAGISQRTVCILLAEDDAQMRRMLASVLRDDGYDVIEARNGAEMLQYLGSSQLHGRLFEIDMIVSDIRMPGVTGLEILADLRRAGWETPVILITAFGDQETHARADRLRAAAVFDKPFDVEKLLCTVRELLPPT